MCTSKQTLGGQGSYRAERRHLVPCLAKGLQSPGVGQRPHEGSSADTSACEGGKAHESHLSDGERREDGERQLDQKGYGVQLDVPAATQHQFQHERHRGHACVWPTGVARARQPVGEGAAELTVLRVWHEDGAWGLLPNRLLPTVSRSASAVLPLACAG